MRKATGLAAFTRPKASADAGGSGVLALGDTSGPSVGLELPTLRRKRGGGETVALTVKVKRTDWQRLRQLADAEGTTIQAIAEAGFSAVLAKHGLPPISSR